MSNEMHDIANTLIALKLYVYFVQSQCLPLAVSLELTQGMNMS